MIITMKDMRRVGFCASGVEAFFKRENLDFQDFVANGIEDKQLLETNSALARKCVRKAVDANLNQKED